MALERVLALTDVAQRAPRVGTENQSPTPSPKSEPRPADGTPGRRMYGIRLFGDSSSRIAVKQRDKWLWIDLGAIVQVVADDDYVVIHASGRRHMVYVRLSELMRRYPRHFVRVSRSRLVGVAHVRSVSRFPGRRVALVLSDGTAVVASRRLTSAVMDALPEALNSGVSRRRVPLTEAP